MSNQLTNLNDVLFSQLDRLTAENVKGDQLREEIDRARAISTIARDIIENAKLALEAHRTVGKPGPAPAMLGIEAPK